MSQELKAYTIDEVSQHNTTDDLWIVYNGRVYDVTKYLDEHPGGEEVVVDVAGSDATEAFNDIGHSDDAHEILSGLLVGKLEGGVVKETTSIMDRTGGESSSTSFPLIAVVVFLIASGAYYFLQLK
ncbi:cytochrome b5-like heme/steroid binding domain-containing protein [Scheffersomyces coipomensis]|uniref:cytochrome b5-like heme/steroid binding domain-containing protein n=1 Tax=Scheffersomyces coipomensis TaxID=1788519 RepID=UPI00315D288B